MAEDDVAVVMEVKATDPIKDDPTLPRVLLIGDSISIGCERESTCLRDPAPQQRHRGGAGGALTVYCSCRAACLLAVVYPH
jgi:hypothetical protein